MEPPARPRYLDAITALFVTTLVVSNVIAGKQVAFTAAVILPAAVILFPLTYILGDVLTEVYGYQRCRRVIWIGFACNAAAVAAIAIGGALPPAGFWDGQEAYVRTLGAVPRIVAASFLAYLVGEFVNSFVLAKLKVATSGRLLWLRTIASTIVGQGIDSILFFTIAFGASGFLPWSAVFNAAVSAWIAKSVYEIVATPLTYLVVGWLKRTEQMDAYDAAHSLNPFGVFGDGPDRNAAAAGAAPRAAGGAAD